MRRIILILTLIIAVIPAFSKKRTFRVDVGRFDKVAVIDNLEVIYHCHPDSTGMAVYDAEESLADVLLFTNSKGSLKVQLATEEVARENLPVIHLYSDYLTSVANSSDKPLIVKDNKSVPRFVVKLIGNGKVIADGLKASEVEASLMTGNGSIVVSGSCGKAVLKMVGTGTINADRLKTEIVNCKIMGSGTIGCWPLSRLDVRGIGSTKIYYKGTPTIKKVGGGKLFPLTDENGEELNSVTAD